MNGRARWMATATATATILAVTASAAHAAQDATERLVRAYTPTVMLREQQEPPCDSEAEQYAPTTVDVVLGNPRVKLVYGPKGRKSRVITRAPTAADIAGRGDSYYLDLPGNTLEPGCTYGRDFANLEKQGKAPALTYAHIATQPGYPGLVVQYWFFYYFNQFNDLHEGDWEGIQVVFDDSATPAQALADGPDRIVVFQHGGGEPADWDDSQVQKEGTHPVVYPAAGSHATFFDSALYLGNGQGGAGLGCDNTTDPLRRVRLSSEIVPTAPARGSPYQWLTYTGRWGQREAGYNNGPTGPNTKKQWLRPFTWMENLRSHTPRIPGGSLAGPTITGTFCSVAASISAYFNFSQRTPTGAIIIGILVLVLLAIPLKLTRWRPVDIDHLRIERAFGQLIRAARQLYGRYWHTLLLMGLIALPIVLGVTAIQWGIEQLGANDIFGGAVELDVASTLGEAGRSIGIAVVGAIVITFLRGLERGEPTGFAGSYRAMRPRFWRVVFGQLLVTALLLMLVLTIIGIPIAIWKFVSWQFVQQEILFQDRTLRGALRGSSRLVRGRWWRTIGVTGILWLISVVPGPVITLGLVFTSLPLWLINVLGAVVFALLIPYVATGRTLLYLDLSVKAEARDAAPARHRRLPHLGRRATEPGTA